MQRCAAARSPNSPAGCARGADRGSKVGGVTRASGRQRATTLCCTIGDAGARHPCSSCGGRRSRTVRERMFARLRARPPRVGSWRWSSSAVCFRADPRCGRARTSQPPQHARAGTRPPAGGTAREDRCGLLGVTPIRPAWVPVPRSIAARACQPVGGLYRDWPAYRKELSRLSWTARRFARGGASRGSRRSSAGCARGRSRRG